MQMARLAAACRTDLSLSGRVIPVRFMEESHEIFTIADFWLEALVHFGRELAKADPETSFRLRAIHSDLKLRWRERDIDERARAAVLGTAERLNMHLVFMVENLQTLVDNVDEIFGWGLRHALQTESSFTLVVSATRRFDALYDIEHPFFELFRPLRLDPLDTKSCHRLWKSHGGGERSESEIEPVRILTGGNPRLIVTFASVARHSSFDRLLYELAALIDDRTEYFRSQLERMPKTERRVFLALVDLWRPSATGEIAARASLGIRMVSTMLGRLVDRGAVLFSGAGKKRVYFAAENLFCIYYKLRRERDSAQSVQDLIRFMRLVFGETERQAILGAAKANGDFKDEADAWIQWPDSRTLIDRVHAELGNGDISSAKATFHQLRHQVGLGDKPKVQSDVAHAMRRLAWAMADIGSAEAALRECDELEAILSVTERADLGQVRRQLKWARIKPFAVLEDFPAAANVFRSVFSECNLGDDNELQELLLFIIGAIAGGTPEKIFLDVFAEDRNRSIRVVPLVVALQRRVGDGGPEPAEILAVAEAIQKRIEDQQIQH